MYFDGQKSFFKAVIHYNKPYALAKSLKRTEEINPRKEVGIYYKIVKNGEDPLKQQKEKRSKLNPK